MVVATLSMAGTLGMSIERFIFLRREFSNMTPDFNHSISLASHDANEDYVFDDTADHVLGDVLYCTSWTCLNDFTFAVVILVNLGKYYHVTKPYRNCSIMYVLTYNR